MAGTTIETLVARVSAKFDSYFKSLHRAGDQTRDLGKAWAEAGAAVGRAAARLTAAAAAVGGVATKRFADFEETMVRVGGVTQTLGKRGEAAFNQLKNAALTAGKTTRFTATQSAEALENLGRAGLGAETSMEALTPTLQLASAAQIDIAQAAEVSAKTMRAFGLEADELGRINDVLIGGSSRANLTLFELFEGLSKVGSVATVMGEDLEDVTSIIGIMADAGVDASTAGIALRNAFIKISNPTKRAKEILDQYRIDTSQPMIGVLQQLEAALKGTTTEMEQVAIFTELFGVRGGPQLLSVFSRGTEEASKLSQEIRGMQGVAQQLEQAGLKTLNGQLDLTISALDGLILSLGEKLAPVAARALQGIVEFIEANETEIIDLMSDSIGQLAEVGQELVMSMLESGPAMIEVAQGAMELLKPILELIKEFPILGKMLVAMKVAQLTGLTGAFGSLTRAIYATAAAIVEQAIPALIKYVAQVGMAQAAMTALKFAAAGLAVAGILYVAKSIYEANDAIQEFNKQLERAAKLNREINEGQDKRFRAIMKEADGYKNASQKRAFLTEQLELAEKNVKGLTAAVKRDKEQVELQSSAWKEFTGNKVLQTYKDQLKETEEGLEAAKKRAELLKEALEEVGNTPQPGAMPGAPGIPGAPQMPGMMQPGAMTPGIVPEDEIEAQIRDAQLQRADQFQSGFSNVREFVGQRGVTGSQVARFATQQEGVTPGMAQQFGQQFQQLSPAQKASEEFMDQFVSNFLKQVETLKQSQEKAAQVQEAFKNRIAEGNANTSRFVEQLRELRDSKQLTGEKAVELANQHKKLRNDYIEGRVTADKYRKGLQSLTRATQDAVEAAKKKEEQEKREALLRGDFQGAGLNFGQAVQDRIAQHRMNQFNQGVDAFANRLLGLGNSVQRVGDRFGGLSNSMVGFQNRLDQANVDPQKAAEAQQKFAAFLNSNAGQIANLEGQIQLLTNSLSFVDTARRRIQIMDEIEGLRFQINQLSSAPPPQFTEQSGERRSEGRDTTEEITINLPGVSQFDRQAVSLVDEELRRERSRRGDQL